MVEILNPCNEAVRFDDQGLPMAQQEGHGMGVRSIVAFCRKHDAVCQFDLTDGTFRCGLFCKCLFTMKFAVSKIKPGGAR